MDSPPDLSGSDRDDDHERPITPEGDEGLHPYSNTGLGILTTPPRVRRPASAASRRSSSYSPKSNASRRSRRGSDDADRSNQGNLPTISSILENVVHPNQLQRELSDESQSLWGATDVAHNDASTEEGGQARPHNEKDNSQDRNKGAAHAHDYNTLVEAKKLRKNNTALEKQIKALEAYCETQQRELELCQEKEIAAEQLAESRRQEVVEIKRSKDQNDKELAESQTQARALQQENESLRLLAGEKGKLFKAEWDLGTLYGEFERKEAEVSSLSIEVQQLRESKEQSDRARRKIERECKNLNEQIMRCFVWIQEAHKQQAQRDMEQFRLDDEHFLSYGRRRTSTNRDSVLTSAAQQEILGDFISSRPQSGVSQSVVSSARQSLVSDKVLFRSLTYFEGARSPSVLVTSPQAICSPAEAQSSAVGSDNIITENRPPSSKRVSFHLEPTPPRYRVPGSPPRRQSDPPYRKTRPRKPSILRNSAVADREYQNGPAHANHGRRLTTTFEDDEAAAGRAAAGRSLSIPTTRKEHAEVREALQSTPPLRIIWDKSTNQAVFQPEPITTADETKPLPWSQADADSGGLLGLKKLLNGRDFMLKLGSRDSIADQRAHIQEGTLQPAVIGIIQRIFTTIFSPTPAAKATNSLWARAVSSNVPTIDDGTAISSALDYPPSPGLRRRQRGTSASPSQIPLHHMGPFVNSENDKVSNIRRKPNRWLIPPVRKLTMAALTIVAITTLCSLVLLPYYTNMLSFKSLRLFCDELPETPASSEAIPSCLPCASTTEDPAPKTCPEQPKVSAKTETVTAWPRENWTSTFTETDTLTELLIMTDIQTQTRIHAETVTKTQTVVETSTNRQTEIKTETLTVFVGLASPLPPTRSFRLQIQVSNSRQNNTRPSAAGPIPGASPSPELYGNNHWVCPCPSTPGNNQCEKPKATSLFFSPGQHSQSFGPTALEIDERAKRARHRSLQLQHIYTAPTYWGLLPSLQQQLEILQYNVLELLLGGEWGARVY